MNQMAVNRERKMVSMQKEDVDIAYVTLAAAAKEIAALIDSYGPDARIGRYTDYDGRSRLAVFVEELENDTQYANRVEYEECREADRERRDRKEFERLQKKFGSS
jgi:hypothetical protein